MSIKYLLSFIWWELKIQMKSFQILFMLFFFGISLSVIYHYSLEENIFYEPSNYYGLFLISIFFMVILLSGRGLQREKEAGAYKMILMSPMPRYIFYLSRIITKSLIIILIVFFYQIIYKILLIGQISFHSNDGFLLVLFIPCIFNLLALGEIVSLMSSGNRMRELVLPALFFPLSLPVFIVYASIIRNISKNNGEELSFHFFLTENFILPVILAIIYVLVGIMFFSNLSIEEG